MNVVVVVVVVQTKTERDRRSGRTHLVLNKRLK